MKMMNLLVHLPCHLGTLNSVQKENLRVMKLTALIKMICWLRVSCYLIHMLKFLLGLVRLQIPKKSRMLLKLVRGTLKFTVLLEDYIAVNPAKHFTFVSHIAGRYSAKWF